MTETGLAVVTGPTQVLHAREALGVLGTSTRITDLVVVPSSGGLGAGLDVIVGLSPWRSVEVVTASGVMRRRWAARLRRQAAAAAVTVLGDLRTPFLQHIAAGARRPVLVDDGNATLLFWERRRRAGLGEPLLAERLAGPDTPSRTRVVGQRLTGLRPREIVALELVTIYDVDSLPGLDVRRHRFEQLRTDAVTEPVEQGSILGTNAADTGLLDSTAYDELIGRAADLIRRRLPGAPVRYLPHRREPTAAVDALCRRHAVTPVVEPRAVELRFVQDGPDRCVVGILSSALDSLAVLSDGAIRPVALRPPDTAWSLLARPQVEFVYQRLARSASGVDVVDSVDAAPLGDEA